MDIAKGLIAIGAGLAVMTGMMTGIGEGLSPARRLRLSAAIRKLKVKFVRR